LAIHRYHSRLAAAAQVMPITSADMQAPVTLGPHALPPTLALGGAVDGIVMEYQLRDAAEFFGTRAVVVPGVAHDLMLVRFLHPLDWTATCFGLKLQLHGTPMAVQPSSRQPLMLCRRRPSLMLACVHVLPLLGCQMCEKCCRM